MDYRWHWGVLLQPVATGEPAIYVDWLLSGLANTVELTLFAFALALVIGTAFGVMRTLPNRIANAAGTAYVSIFRGVPLIVQFFIWFFVVPELLPTAMGDWLKSLPSHPQFLIASVLSLGVYTGSRICEQVRAGIRARPPGQMHAAFALGLTRAQAYRYVLLPVTFRTILSPLTSEFLVISKNSAVASTIGLLELSGQARQLVDYTAQPYESFICVTLSYMALNFVILHGMGWIRRRTALPGMIGD
ncbi:amino acid ABC transporter permease [Paraburkholderia rhynchosiae]|uniref:Amino acid ABC transporter permease n=1 Tax=Paraburkholderia rhynchosiae TaxID=487049 RepID=A0A2N7WXF6_9BURK|nr:amino acid ABC transporter permease [Paraburkholderia rhynchosiae]PMS34021.1 amino acid ABC transporter permease [Paraburkholderia rhynchosiae]CAB3635999.1 Glutamate/aspartate import permease protein GltJ [Paraburkholderia rhynchosiae]